MSIQLAPAYGRDYTSAQAAVADFDADKDFVITDISNKWNGKMVNKSQLAGYTVKIRYNQLRRVTIVEVPNG